MQQGSKPLGSKLLALTWAGVALISVALAISGCQTEETVKPVPEPRFPTLPLAEVPSFMHATLFERVRFTGIEPMPVYGYSLVVNLHDTGDSTAPTWVRDYISKQIRLRGFDSLTHRYAQVSPQDILHDKRVAIVIVEGQVPVGARKGQRFDVAVRAMPMGHTSSLAHGRLYQTDLSDHGLQNPSAIGAHLLAAVDAGDVFVNPAYALSEGKAPANGDRSSLLTGEVLNAGISQIDRPIGMQLRQPQLSTARLIEELMARRWNTPSPHEAAEMDRSAIIARAESEGMVEIFVPWTYRGDWKHFLGVVSHMYLNDSPAFISAKAHELCDAAHKPNAPLADISLCWEALGPGALSIFEPLISDPNPSVAFAAARAASFCDDPAAREALLRMASDPDQPNQLDAVRALGGLPVTPETNHMLRSLLDGNKADIRIAAYGILSEIAMEQMGDRDSSGSVTESEEEYGLVTVKVADRFMLDIVPSDGPPLVYASTSGVPRIAVFGRDLTLETPITFTAMDTRFSISSSDGTNLLEMFYRDPQSPTPVEALTHNDLAQIIPLLGGRASIQQEGFNFTFNDVVAIVQKLVDSRYVYGTGSSGEHLACAFELEHPRLATDAWSSLPTHTETGRPQGNGGPMIDPEHRRQHESQNESSTPTDVSAGGSNWGQ